MNLDTGSRKGLPGRIRLNEPLAPYVSFRLGGPADVFAEPTTDEELAEVVAWCRERDMPIRILGGGTNLLVSDEGVSGAVVRTRRLRGPISRLGEDLFQLPSASSLGSLVSYAADRGLGGVECLAGIPGTVGGAVAGNAGGKHGEIGLIVESVRILDWSGVTSEIGRDDLQFDYRRGPCVNGVILSVVLRLRPEDGAVVSKRTDAILMAKKAAQPLSQSSAGCCFKNPEGDSAGRLIEACGLKGQKVGGALVSRKHANFIVNTGGAAASDVLCLIERIRREVAEKFGVCLELEVDIWN